MQTIEFDRTSPILEKHMDFLLEEEFVCNPKFLPFFIALANIGLANNDAQTSLPSACEPVACHAIGSVTDDSGETDIQVIYTDQSNHKTAILIEDKIRAGFQPTQAERYKERGKSGVKNRFWTDYRTCLFAPQHYGSGNHGFDARVSIEDLKQFFTGNTPRENFRLDIFERALKHFETKGVQQEDARLTKFRADYADAATSFFTNAPIRWQPARTAWSNDTWFRFNSAELPKGSYITHKAPEGHVDLSFPDSALDALQSALNLASDTVGIDCAQTGKSASLQIRCTKVDFFADVDSQRVAIDEAFKAVVRLQHIWQRELATIALYDHLGLHLKR